MRGKFTRLAVAGIVALLGASLAPAQAATLRPCLAGHQVKVVKGKATMVVKGKRVPCRIVKATPKPTPTPSATSTNPPIGVNIRFAGDTMNSLTVRAGLTVTLRNADPVAHTFVIASEGISVLVPANDISAFLAPTKTGTYQMTTAENPNIKGILVVIP